MWFVVFRTKKIELIMVNRGSGGTVTWPWDGPQLDRQKITTRFSIASSYHHQPLTTINNYQLVINYPPPWTTLNDYQPLLNIIINQPLTIILPLLTTIINRHYQPSPSNLLAPGCRHFVPWSTVRFTRRNIHASAGWLRLPARWVAPSHCDVTTKYWIHSNDGG